MTPKRLLGATLVLLAASLSAGTAAAQHNSTVCDPQTGTVTSGGQVTIDITDCATNIAFAGTGVIDGGSNGPADFEDHGTAVTRIVGTQWLLDYSHNGTTGVGGTDVFEITEASPSGNGDVRVTISITPSGSPITVEPAVFPALTAGVPVSQTLTSTGGVGSYTYTPQAGALPPGLSLSSDGVISGTPTRRGGYSFSVRSTDSNGQFVDKGYTGSVANPTLALTTPSGTAARNQPFSLQLAVSGGVAPYSFQLETGTLPSGITLSTGGLLSGTTNASDTSFPVTIRVTDSSTGPGQYFEVESFTLTVTNNQPPVADAGQAQTVASGAGVTLDGNASSDPENQPLSFAWTQTGGPAVTLTGANTAAPTFTAPTVPFNASPVVLTFALVVNDGVQNSPSDSVTVTVNPAVNQVPTADAGQAQTVASGAGVTLDGNASSDPENQPLTYAWTQTGGPAVTLTGANTAAPTFTAPTVAFNASPVVLTFALVVNDGVQDSPSDSVTVTVNPAVNQVPTADAGQAQTVASGAGVTLDGNASSDPENQPLTYAWTQTGGPAVTLTGANTAAPTFTAPTVAFNASPVVLTFALVVNDGVQNSLSDSVTVTVNPAVNQVPTADAGQAQTVASGAGVTLDGSASSDPENQPLTYAWTQSGGPSVTLTGANTAAPTFTAPTLAFNAPDAVLTFSLVVNDGVQDSPADTVSITVTAPVDVTNPTVTLAGMPPSVLPGAEVQISVTFSEDVTGLAAGDFTVTNGTATGLTGSGASYTLTVTAGGGGTLAVSLPADQAIDVAGNGNLASNVVEAGAAVIGETEEAIATYLQQRANALVAAQPGLIRLINPGGVPEVSVSTKGFTFSIAGDHPVWASLTGSWGDSGDNDIRYVLGTVGTHARLDDRTILGVMLQLDQMRTDEPGRRIEGTGWLIGPYVAGQVQDQPLFYEGRLLWGETRNEIAQFGLPADRFDSERLLAQIRLQGQVTLGSTSLQPFVDGSYVSDRQQAYVDGLGNPIGAQKVEQTQLALGLDATWRIEQGGGVLEPLAGFSAIYSDSSGTGVAATVDPAFDGWRGKLRGGLRYTTGASVIDLTTFFDGIGTDDHEDYGLSFSFSTRF